MAATSFRLEGLEETVSNLNDLSRATQKNVVRRALMKGGEVTANVASSLAPTQSGRLAFSIVVSRQLTRRQRRGGKVNEVEVYIGPAGGQGALGYASFVEFGTVETPAQPYLRPGWESTKGQVLAVIQRELKVEVDKAAARAARRAAKAAGR